MAEYRVESTREPIDYRSFIKSMRRLERIYTKCVDKRCLYQSIYLKKYALMKKCCCGADEYVDLADGMFGKRKSNDSQKNNEENKGEITV